MQKLLFCKYAIKEKWTKSINCQIVKKSLLHIGYRLTILYLRAEPPALKAPNNRNPNNRSLFFDERFRFPPRPFYLLIQERFLHFAT